jgi:hypothetical protein
LFEEGQAMHHCVGSYAADLMHGSSRIYAVTNTETGKKLATLEFTCNRARRDASGMLPKVTVWKIAQCKGPCNEGSPADVANAATVLLKRINKGPSCSTEPTGSEALRQKAEAGAL